jgi:hypothetical protein
MEYKIISVSGELIKTTNSIDEVNNLINYSSSYHTELSESGSKHESYYWYPLDSNQINEFVSGSSNSNDDVFFILDENHWNTYQLLQE